MGAGEGTAGDSGVTDFLDILKWYRVTYLSM